MLRSWQGIKAKIHLNMAYAADTALRNRQSINQPTVQVGACSDMTFNVASTTEPDPRLTLVGAHATLGWRPLVAVDLTKT